MGFELGTSASESGTLSSELRCKQFLVDLKTYIFYTERQADTDRQIDGQMTDNNLFVKM